MPGNSIPLTGEVGGVSATDAARLSVVAVVGTTVLATAQLRPDGSYRLNVPAAQARAESAFAVQVAVLPITAAAAPDRVADAPRVTISPAALDGDDPIKVPDLALDHTLIEGWLIFWREWCVSGTVVGPDGCPVPGADVTAYTVSWGTSGCTEIARATVATAPDGTFALYFLCWELLFRCWPCEPLWWRCWPWCWEFDILHVIEALETRATSGSQSVALFQPEGSALIRGQGYPAAATAGVRAVVPAEVKLAARLLAWPRHGPAQPSAAPGGGS
ncbi:MAG: carboxypeptidase-like regulatory domain-containing protein, partial [Actinomycetota bacterium]|nr:carboxypeptidase-like regulatory domain-containing protein [Actinomycetota bacterium]